MLRGCPLLASVAYVTALGCARTAPPPPDGVYTTTAVYESRHTGAVAATRQEARYWVAVGVPVTASRATLTAEDNANSKYQLFFAYPGSAPCKQGLAVFGGVALLSESNGSSPGTCDLSFYLDAQQATAAARVLGIPRKDRHPAGERVVGTFAPSQSSYERGQKVEVVLTLENPADAPRVNRRSGGSSRGPRDNQFWFAITRDGREVPKLEADDYGGWEGKSPLDAGARVTLRAPLASWGDVNVPGKYSVECRYRVDFSPIDVAPEDELAARWSRDFTGAITFEVR